MDISDKDLLQRRAHALTEVLSTDEYLDRPLWLDRIGQCLTELVTALRAHIASNESSKGVLTELASPEQDSVATLDRKVKELRLEHSHLMESAVQLHWLVQNAVREMHGIPSNVDHAIDVSAIRGGCEELLNGLRNHQECETKLLMDTITTDVGVGD